MKKRKSEKAKYALTTFNLNLHTHTHTHKRASHVRLYRIFAYIAYALISLISHLLRCVYMSPIYYVHSIWELYTHRKCCSLGSRWFFSEKAKNGNRNFCRFFISYHNLWCFALLIKLFHGIILINSCW